MIAPDLSHLAVPVDSLIELPGNPRRGDVAAVAASLEKFGQRKPIVVRASDRTITAGNHTWLAARQLGWAEIAAVVLDDDEATSQAFALADNRTADLGTYDESALADLIRSVGDADPDLLAATGWAEDAVAELLARVDNLTALPTVEDPDAVPELPDDPVSVLGDVWVLGPHRVVCGDSTDVGVWDLLLGGALADCVWTDPPYNVAVTGGTHDARDQKNYGKGPRIQNDRMTDTDFREFLDSAFAALWTNVREGGSVYVCHADSEGINFRCAFRDTGFFLHQVLIWVKQGFVFGRSDYHWQHEPILYGWKLGKAHEFHGERNQSTTWTVDRPMRSAMEHPTQKPVALPTIALLNSSRIGEVIADPFGGSGSTLIAAHMTGRVARLVEIDPRYVDVICRRYQEAFGDKPVLESTGEPHDFTR